jgi:nitrogen-specific signal transduction histidine kinase
MTESLILLDTGGTIRLANRASKDLIGIPDRELNGASFSSLVVEKGAVKDLLADTLQYGRSINRNLRTLPDRVNRSRSSCPHPAFWGS